MSNKWFQSLAGSWQFRQADTADWYPAVVPGSVHTDLAANQRIEDPFWGLNEKGADWISRKNWEYQRVFQIEDDLFAADQVDLVCEGLDTLADVYINGRLLYSTANMFRPYHWDIKSCLIPGENIIKIVFHSPQTFIEDAQAENRLPFLSNPGMGQIRKAQSHFGWDWGPALPTVGIWRSIYLQGYYSARLNDIQISQEHDAAGVNLAINVSCHYWAFDSLLLKATLQAPDGSCFSYSAGFTDAGAELAYFIHEGCASLTIHIPDPQLWWPNGLGAQPLYQLSIGVAVGNQSLDTQFFQLGLRKIELRRLPDRWGESFQFLINGVAIFAKGANWIPADAFPALVQDEKLEYLLQSAAQANMNMLRVWGGGYYESEQFYDLCDRYGLLVWQDFMFACAVYPLDGPKFVSLLRSEVDAVVRRLRHRACLVVWCGNNELETLWPLMRPNRSVWDATKRYFYEDLPAQVKSLDHEHPYWPSSPSSGRFLQKPNSDSSGDTHLWEVWHGFKAPSAYLKRKSRFVSEFGMQSLPAVETILDFGGSDAMDLTSPVLVGHQKAEGGMERLLYYLSERFSVPEKLADLVYLSQIIQAETVRIGAEHWRRQYPRSAGALFWQLNDCWPAVSWSSIDYYGRWKALQYAARRFFAPVTFSLEQTKQTVKIHLVNDTPVSWDGEISWSLESLKGEILNTGHLAASAKAFSADCLVTLDFSSQLKRRKDLVFVAELAGLAEDGMLPSQRQVTLFEPEKGLSLPDPAIELDWQFVGTEKALITLKSSALARFVQLAIPEYDVIFSDNFFDLPAGRNQQVTCILPARVDPEKIRQSLTVRSLYGILPKYTQTEQTLRRILIGAKPANLISRLYFLFKK